jgi:hypothetical protein
MKILADTQLAIHENIGGYPKHWRIMKILADTQNIGGS